MPSLKSTLIALAAAALLPVAAATAADAQSPTFLVKLGPTHAWRTASTEAEETTGRTGFGGGGGVRLGTGNVAIELGILITAKGTERDVTGGSLRLNIEYIELPVLAFLTFPSRGKLQPFLLAGPVLGLEMRCKSIFVQQNSKDEVGCDRSTLSTFDRNKVDLSAAGAVGLMYNIGNDRRIGLEARYTHGFRNIADDDENPDFEVRNRAASLFVSYSFPLFGDG